MSTLVELLAKHLDEWPTYDTRDGQTEEAANMCQNTSGEVWINRTPEVRQHGYDEDEGSSWGSDWYKSFKLEETASDCFTAIVTKEMWEEARRSQAPTPENDVENW